MTNEEKDLLIKDLCARLPYHLRGKSKDGKLYEATVIYDTGTILASEVDGINTNICCGFKPYLRPMSSMTDKEKKELEDICTMCNSNHSSTYEFFGIEIFNNSRYGTNFESDYTAIDWLNSHHFDYRDLIGKGLALEAPEGMY